MKIRKLGKTDIEVTEVGMGCWQLGNVEDWGQPMSDQEGIELVYKALELGCNFFDTAPPYAKGNSETVLGKALKGKRQQSVICTKFGYTHKYTVDFSVAGLRKSVENSLSRLQTDYLDILLVHSPADDFYKTDMPQFKELEVLKQEGKIRAFGVSVDTSEHLNCILDNTTSEVFEVLYNIFHQEPALVFDKAKKEGVGLICKVPLDSGWLSGKYNQSTTFDGARSRWTKAQIEERFALVEKVKEIVGDYNLIDVALQFSLSHPAIASTIPGVKNNKQLEGNIKAVSYPLPDTLISELRDFWEKNLKDNGVDW